MALAWLCFEPRETHSFVRWRSAHNKASARTRNSAIQHHCIFRESRLGRRAEGPLQTPPPISPTGPSTPVETIAQHGARPALTLAHASLTRTRTVVASEADRKRFAFPETPSVPPPTAQASNPIDRPTHSEPRKTNQHNQAGAQLRTVCRKVRAKTGYRPTPNLCVCYEAGPSSGWMRAASLRTVHILCSDQTKSCKQSIKLGSKGARDASSKAQTGSLSLSLSLAQPSMWPVRRARR